MTRQWQLDDLSPEDLGKQLDLIKSFVIWLHENDIRVPDCWYTHGWLRLRLCALFYLLADGSSAEAAVKWWEALQNLQHSEGWRAACEHGTHHADEESHGMKRIATFEQTKDALVKAREQEGQDDDVEANAA